MPAKRKGNKKRQNNGDETDDILKVGENDEKFNLSLAKKRRKSDKDEHKKEQSTSADPSPGKDILTETMVTKAVTETMVIEDKQEEVTDDKTVGPGADLLMVSDKVRAIVLLEDIKSRSTERNDKDKAGNRILDPGTEFEATSEDVTGRTDCIVNVIDEAKIDSSNRSDDANTTNTLPINILKGSNELCLSGDIDDKKTKNPVASIEHNINELKKEKSDNEEWKSANDSENKDLKKDSSDKVSMLLDSQRIDSTLQDKNGPHKPETKSTSKKMDIIMDHIERFAEQNLIGTGDKCGNDEITIVHESKETSNEIIVNKETIQDVLINKNINFSTEFQDCMKQAKSTVTPHDMIVDKEPAQDLPDGHEITSEQNKSEVLTDSQLCDFDWMSQFPEEQENSLIENSDQIPTMPRECGDADQQIEDGSTIIRGFIKELSNLNKMILKTKREIENTRRQKKNVTK